MFFFYTASWWQYTATRFVKALHEAYKDYILKTICMNLVCSNMHNEFILAGLRMSKKDEHAWAWTLIYTSTENHCLAFGL